MIDQLLLYDQSVVTWVTNTLPPLLEGRNTQVLVSTARKAFADVTTARLADNETLTTPRIAVTRLDYVNDPIRFNSNRVRRLGWCSTPVQHALRSAKFPAPVNISYQVDLWTRFAKEMNLWVQQVMFDFASQYIYLSIRPDSVWQDKLFIVFLEGGVADNSELDPGEGDRIIRRTFTLRVEGWIFDQSFLDVGVVKSLEFQWFDQDLGTAYEFTFLPPIEVVGQGTGAQTTFNFTLERPPVLSHTFTLQTLIGAAIEHVQDDGAGNLSGTNVSSGTIDYNTGAVSITYSTPPDSGANLNATYFMDLS